MDHSLLEQPLVKLDPELLVKHHSEPRDPLIVSPLHLEQLELAATPGLEPSF